METLRICKQCLKALPENAPEGLCPECLARVALGSEPAVPGTRVPPTPATLAAQFPQLEILELLGVGGMGMVYKARQPRVDRYVALKILPIASMPDASFGERFEREAKALARLNHPGIVTLYDFGQTSEYYYFVMEFVDGMNLRRLIQAGSLEPRQALELVTQICTALQFAHDEKIVHRDIKPENILITKKGQVKIADFGLAKLVGGQPDTALTASQMVMGTLNYMAPEQRENTKDVDHRADIYSLGVVFYEMLTGEVPMGRFDAPSKKVQIDVRLDEVVLHALEREPARRYQHISEVKTNVESISSTMPAGSAPTPKGAPPAASTRKKTVGFWLCAYGLFCLGWLATKMLWNFRGPGCWLACFGMAALVMCVSGITVKRMRLFPVQFSLKKAMPKYLWGLVPIFLTLTLGFVFLIGAFFNLWEEDPMHGNFYAKSPAQFEVANKGQEYKLIRNLDAFTNDIPSVELGVSKLVGRPVGFTDVSFPFPPWKWSGPPGNDHYLTIDLLMIGCFLLFWGPFCLICGWRGPGTKPFRVPWRNVLASLAVSACVLGSVLPVYIVCHRSNGYSSQSGQFFSKTKTGTVADTIQKWAVQNGYALGNEVEWDINTVPKGKRVAKVSIRDAWKPSPFDRWHSTWTSFHRISPSLTFELVSSENPDQTMVYASSTMIGTIPEDLFPFLTRYDQTNLSGK
jgi:serine/threonine protein kinase